MIIQICVGSSCHLKGSEEIVSLLQEAVAQHHLEDRVTLAGSFCIGQCNRIGVTVQVDEQVYTGITKETFSMFFQEKVLNQLKA
ncbi:MAG: (2Fe-2S) ferredoxin domain-containing protein [Clostridia bacterium]|nr:(2Fe-2S) ferredoxin domain-containing protein [Clostridia bacterium]MBR6862216.1 (2Fe-2S) ferredoxin domain-containing protein [Acidaminococcaceae bacterium]